MRPMYPCEAGACARAMEYRAGARTERRYCKPQSLNPQRLAPTLLPHLTRYVTGQMTGQRAVTGQLTGHVSHDRFHVLDQSAALQPQLARRTPCGTYLSGENARSSFNCVDGADGVLPPARNDRLPTSPVSLTRRSGGRDKSASHTTCMKLWAFARA